MAGPMASNVDRRTLGARLKATWRWADWQLIGGLDGQTDEHRQRSSMGIDTYESLPRKQDAEFHNYGVFGELTWYAAERDPPDQRRAAGPRLGQGFPPAHRFRDERPAQSDRRPDPRRQPAQRFHALRA